MTLTEIQQDAQKAKRRAAVAAYEAHDNNAAAAARSLGIPRPTLQGLIRVAKSLGEYGDKIVPVHPAIEYPAFPDDDLPTEQIVEHLASRFEKRQASFDAHTWFEIKIKETKPIGIWFFGDPHVDDNGCNWPVLRRDVRIVAGTPGLYGGNIGDTTNNWAGRLMQLYAKQDTSIKTAQRLASWFMLDSGVKWLVWLLGNHDVWGDGAAVLTQMAKRFGTQKIVCHDWEARFCLTFPNGKSFRVWASHDFPGHSQWNELHGPMKAAKMDDDAHLYVCGHKHNWRQDKGENASRGTIQTIARARGYKFLDDHARKFRANEQQTGHGVMAIFDPRYDDVMVDQNIERGAEYLTFLRSQ